MVRDSRLMPLLDKHDWIMNYVEMLSIEFDALPKWAVMRQRRNLDTRFTLLKWSRDVLVEYDRITELP
jgi:hypothetical protein